MKQRLKKYIGDKAFYQMALAIIIPVVIQQIILSIAGYVDNMMINSYSQVAYTGVSTSNRFMFLIFFFWIGLASGISVFVSQYHGAKMKDKIQATIQLALIVAAVFAVISTLAIYFFGPMVIKLFIPGTNPTDIEAVGYGVDYIRIIGFGSTAMILTFMISNIYRSLGRPRVPLLAGVIGIIGNIILNFVFIYGYLGAPEMGSAGAALATVLSKIIELSILIIVAFFFSENNYARRIWKRLYVDFQLFKNYLKKGTPIVLNEVMWAIGIQLLALFITGGRINWLTSYNYFQNVTDLFFVYYAGIATGTAVLVGSALGEGAFEKAKDYANKLIGIIIMASIIAITLLVAFSPFFLMILTEPSGEIYWNSYYLILITAGFSALYGFNAVVYYVLRAGGDSLRSFLLDQLPTYLVGIPLTFLLYKMEPKWQLGLITIFLASRIIDIIKIFMSAYFYNKGTWVKNLTIDEGVKA